MPAIAAYDSWKPISDMSEGVRVRCMTRLDARVVLMSGFLCSSLVTSPIITNMRARMIDAPAPVAKE